MDIHPGLIELARQRALPLPGDACRSTRALLALLAQHFGTADDPTLRMYLERHDFEQGADLQVLFAIAIRLDDGHGLQAICEEGAWSRLGHCLPAFAGQATFISREVALTETSASILELGQGLRLALARDDLDQAHCLLERHIEQVLSRIGNPATRQALAQKLRQAPI